MSLVLSVIKIGFSFSNCISVTPESLSSDLYSGDNTKHRKRKGGSYSGNLYDE